jgi:hypothetical protein
MAAKNFPGPNINRLIDKDPQIVKVDMDQMGWGSRKSIFGHMNSSPVSQDPGQPSAPEMTIKHVGS